MNKLTIIFSVFCFLYTYYISEYLFFTSLGIAFSVFIVIDFISKLGKTIPLKEFIVFIASLQWIVGAKISYNFGKVHHKYYMYVSEDIYMTYVVPSVILFYFGFSLFSKKCTISSVIEVMDSNKDKLLRPAIALLVLGLASVVVNNLYSGGFSFFFFLSELLLYVGISYLIFVYYKKRYLIFTATLLVVFLISLSEGVFHNLLLIGSFLSFFIIPSSAKFISKVSLIVLCVMCVYVIQTVKKDYRDIIWRSKQGVNTTEVFWQLVKKEFIPDKQDYVYLNLNEEEDQEAEVNNRLNQGWIISKTMQNVPENVPFLKGRTIVESIESSILPRFLFPNKAGAEKGLKNFKEITGLPLSKKASMGLSVVAEFYANFGYWGGMFAIFIYGCFVAISIRFIIQNLGNGSPLIFLWFILFYFQVVKAEIDLIKITNHLVKSIIFFIIIKFLLIQFGLNPFRNNTIQHGN